jgi:hypothetical protein
MAPLNLATDPALWPKRPTMHAEAVAGDQPVEMLVCLCRKTRIGAFASIVVIASFRR